MTYALSFALQEAVYAALTGSAALAGIVDGRVFDAPPHADAGGAPGPYVLIGEEQVSGWAAQGLNGARHDLEIAVFSGPGGFGTAKRAAAAVASALTEDLPALSAGRVATADFLAAKARRTKEGGRRIDLRFRFRVEV